ncbi:hypothetical protein EHM69_03055 [candidate division KSB1 bacterium]|nr:MAG: hypothetical protein EHM69_03055 [candidate division KSB1 bacterium]
MAAISDIVKEEYVQSYLQYRWLDDTRAKLIDRFYVIVIALLGLRLQKNEELLNLREWLFALYGVGSIVIFFLSKSIITFRRQQRGHVKYIAALCDAVYADVTDDTRIEYSKCNRSALHEWEKYRKGRSVFLTQWVEFTVVLIAILLPCFFILDFAHLLRFECPMLFFSIVGVFILFSISWLIIPWWRYNHSKDFKFEKH